LINVQSQGVHVVIPNSGQTTDSYAPALSDEDLLALVCREKRVPVELIVQLRGLEERYSGMGRRHGIAAEMRELVRHTLDDILEGKS
jgi:hypothetical protein